MNERTHSEVGSDRPYLLGTMQGRLLPKYRGRYQAHPVDAWPDEFPLARACGLDLIEFILDYEGHEENPLMRAEGIERIRTAGKTAGVGVRTVCADAFMEAPLHRPETTGEAARLMTALIEKAARLGVTDIVLPCVDQSSLASNDDEKRLIEGLLAIEPLLSVTGVRISLEADLAPERFARLLETLNADRFAVNYDIGNSAALGFPVEREFECYGERVSDIHIKDRVRGGSSVKLGTGAADFQAFFRALENLAYRGPFIMQAYRDDEGVNIFREQLDWIRPRLDEFFGVRA